MAWTSPMTASSGAVFTASQFNTNVRDNLNQTAPALVTAAGQILVSTAANALAARVPTNAYISTSQTTASLSATDLATVGPVVTVTTGTAAIVGISSFMSNNTAGDGPQISWAVTGASTIAAAVNGTAIFLVTSAGFNMTLGGVFLQTGLTAGSNIFTMKYNAAGGGTATFASRNLFVIPL
jgi:hypothetical protein